MRMRRVASQIVILCFLVMGTGSLEYVHNLEHALEDANEARAGRQHEERDRAPAHHDESNCAVHAQLHMPALSGGWVPLLVLLGVFVAFLSEIAPRWTPARWCLNIDCRGPPAC